MYNPTREQVRDMFFETWRKYRAGEPLAGVESIALDVVLLHAEYHAVLALPGKFREKDYSDETNPFLHMSLHVALEEQLSIDQPTGIVLALDKMIEKMSGDRHRAMHEAIECLAETMWRSQRDNAPPDGIAYLGCLERRSRLTGK